MNDFANAPLTTTPHPSAHLLSAILTAAVGAGCSDVHLRPHAPPFGRKSGRLVTLTPVVNGAAHAALVSAADIANMIRISSTRELAPGRTAFEFSFNAGPAFRIRAHAFQASDGWSLALRLVPANVPSFADLRLPAVVKTFAQARPGLVLVTGPMGSGKSTTSAAMLNHLVSEESIHVVTLEDPIEYRLKTTGAASTPR